MCRCLLGALAERLKLVLLSLLVFSMKTDQILQLRFLSRNEHKIKEVRAILATAGVEVLASNVAIEELQTIDTAKLVRDKCLRAFSQIGHAVFVEHTGLYLKSMNDFPGGLTQIFWDCLQPERFSYHFGRRDNTHVVARTVIGYCDGKRIHQFKGETEGRVAPEPRGSQAFQWDCVFIPEGYEETFAELGEEKNSISMRRHALDKFAAYLRNDKP